MSFTIYLGLQVRMLDVGLHGSIGFCVQQEGDWRYGYRGVPTRLRLWYRHALDHSVSAE